MRDKHCLGIARGEHLEEPHLSGQYSKLVHDWPSVHQGDGFWRWWEVAKSTVGSFGVVMFPPVFDDYLRLTQRVKYFSVQ